MFKKNKPFGYILSFLRQFPLGLSSMLLMLLMRGIYIVVTPKLISDMLFIISQYKDNTDPLHLLNSKIIEMVGFMVLVYLSNRTFQYLYTLKSSPYIRERIQRDILPKVLYKSNTYCSKYPPGVLLSKMADLIIGMELLIFSIQNRLLLNLIMMSCVSISLYMVAPIFAVIVVAPFILLVFLVCLSSPKLRAFENSYLLYGSIVYGKIIGALSNSLCVRLFVGYQEEVEAVSKTYRLGIKPEQESIRLNLLLFSCLDVFNIIVLILQFYFLSRGLMNNSISLVNFAFVIFQGNLLSNTSSEIITGIPECFKAYLKVDAALQVIDEECGLQDKPGAENLAIEHGAIRFTNVDFKYPDQKENLLNKLSINIPAKQKVGLVGHSGSGKSSFVNLILRLYDVDSGSITIDGIDIRDVTQDSLHKNIALVPQSPMLFDRSILENIRYGRFDATEAEVIEAAKRASIHEFIDALPEQYNTSASDLSGGQKQRVAMARAILKDAPILILDEATSQLDSVTEREIQASLSTIIEDKTTIVIAHRLSTLDKMDRILVFDKGSIVEDGTHDELMSKGGKYVELWNALKSTETNSPAEQNT